MPKDLWFRGCGILIASLFSLIGVWKPGELLEWFDWRRTTIAASMSILLWTVITALTATRPQLTVWSVVWVISAVLIFLVLERGARHRGYAILAIGMIPAILNSVLAVLQELRVWNPFFRDDIVAGANGGRVTALRLTTAFLGNTNDVGTYLVPSLVCAVTAALCFKTRRPVWIAVTVVLFAGVVVSRSLASFIATAASLIAFALLATKRARLAVIAACLICAIAVVMIPSPVRTRLTAMGVLLRTGQYDQMVSGRLIGSLTAWQMFKDHPVLGVGPGLYGYEFFDDSITVRERSPQLLRRGVAIPNFGEAHNDHLQILGTTGLPGYLLMIGSVILLGSRSFVRSADLDERGRFGRLTSLPLAIAFTVSALAQFPLELAAALTAYLFYSAVCYAWSPEYELFRRQPPS